MELDTIWDEGFCSIMSDELDYEFDENDLFKDDEDVGQTIQNEDSKEKCIQSNLDNNLALCGQKALTQAELNKSALEERISCTSFNNQQDSVNVTPYSLNSSHESTVVGNFIKTEIKRRDSVNSDVFNIDNPIVIDARIFLDSSKGKKEYVDTVPSTLNDCKMKAMKKTTRAAHDQSQKLVTNKKSIETVVFNSDKKHGLASTKVSHKSDRKRIKLIDFEMPSVDKKNQQKKEKNSIKADKKKKYFPESQNENFKTENRASSLKTFDKIRKSADFDEKKIKSKHLTAAVKRQQEKPYCLPILNCDEPTRKLESQNIKNRSTGTEKKDTAVLSNLDKNHSQGKIYVKPSIKQKKHESFVDSKVEKKSKKRINTIPGIEKGKKADCSHSTLDKKSKIQTKVKVNPKNLLSDSPKRQTELEHVDFEPNLKSDTDKKKLDIKQSLSKKRQVNTETNLHAKRFLKNENPQANGKKTSDPGTRKGEFLQDRKDITTVKREKGNLANLKVEPTLKYHQLQPWLVLKKIPDYIVRGLSVRTEFATAEPKAEILDKKSLLRQNLLHPPKTRIVLKRLTEANLQSPARLLSRVKTEMNENVSRKLRSQGKARDKDYIHLYCCKCKNLTVERSQLSKTKYCDGCGFQLIYLCVKCNDKHYVSYSHLFRHLKICQDTGEAKPARLNSIILHRCTECTFKTTYSQVMASHCKTKGHKADGEFDISKLDKRSKARVKRESSKVEREVPESPKIPRNQYAQLIIKQYETSITPVTERYCVQCQKSDPSKTRKSMESCRKCKTPLQLRCLKCQLTRNSYDTMYRHIRSKCCPNSYQCAKCDYTNSTWTVMQRHAMEQHDKKASKSSQKAASKRKRRRENFHCELCNFQTNYKHNVARHVREVHKK